MTVREDLHKSTLEVIYLEIKPVSAVPLIVLAWYGPPNATFNTFDQIERCLQFFDREDKEIILLGDTNCDFLRKYPKREEVN